MLIQLTAIAIFIAIFAIATLRKVHPGIMMFAAACGVGVWLARMPLKDVMGGFPISIMVLLVGVTYFFAIAQVNGAHIHMSGGLNPGNNKLQGGFQIPGGGNLLRGRPPPGTLLDWPGPGPRWDQAHTRDGRVPPSGCGHRA